MVVAQYFVEFMFYSFLGWIWESIYCTIKNKKWADRGFLFGPVCPIYGSCVVAADIIFTKMIPQTEVEMPVWQVFLICMIGSAIAEFLTSWVLEKRFHARWWDYSNMPLNIQGRICLPVSIAFGLAGVVIVKWLLPWIIGLHTDVNPLVYEVLMLAFALLFGADFALTEASLSTLLSSIEEFKTEFNQRAETTYENIASVPKRLEEGAANAKAVMSEGAANAKATMGEGAANAKAAVSEGIANMKESVSESLAERVSVSRLNRAEKEEISAAERAERSAKIRELAENYIGQMSFNQKRILGNIKRFQGDRMVKNADAAEDQTPALSPAQHLKAALERRRNTKE